MDGNPPNGDRPLWLESFEELLRRIGFRDYTIFLLVAAVAGLVTGLGVIVFRAAYEEITGFVIGGGHHVLEALGHQPWWKIVLVPTIGGLGVGLINRYGPGGAAQHGVAYVMNATAFLEGRIPILHTLKGFVTNVATIGTGGSVGPEGPVIALGSGLGSGLGQWMRLSPERVRTLVGCGAAAGLAAAFNAPIAGAIFALEIVLRDFAVVTFSPIIVSAVIGTAVSRAFLGDAPTFDVPPYELVSAWELLLYIVLGAAAGLFGVLFTWTSHHGERWALRIPLPRPLVTGLGGLVLGLGFYLWMPRLWGVGYEPVTELLQGRMTWTLMLLLLVGKLVATNLTLASGFTGGIFAPTVMMGGTLGGLFGLVAGRLFPDHTAPMGAYSLVGMAALMAAVTYAPITSILILFEMTGGYEVILPLMLSCISALVVAQSLSKDSIFTIPFSQQGIDLNYGRESAILRSYYAEDLMSVSPPVMPLTCDFEEILECFLENMEDRYYVVDDAGRLQGSIGIHDIKDVIQEQGLGGVVIAADLVRPVPYMVQQRENLEDTIMLLTSAEAEQLPVVTTTENPVLRGTISQRDILELYNREILHKEVLGIKMVHRDTQGTDFVDLPEQYRVELFPVTAEMAGRTLRELDLRGRHGIHVLAIKRPGRRVAGINELPDPHRVLTRKDRLIVVGRAEDLDAFRGKNESERETRHDGPASS